LQKKNMKRIKYPIYYFGSLCSNGGFVPIGFAFANSINGEILSKCVKIIGNCYEEINVLKQEKIKFSPIIMSDLGKAEMKMHSIVKEKYNLDHVICRFHIIQCWEDYLNKLFSNVSEKEKKINEI